MATTPRIPIEGRAIAKAQFTLNRRLWACIAVVALIDAVWMAVIGMRVNTQLLSFVLPVLSVCLAVSGFYRFVRRDDGIFLFAQAGCQIIAGTLALAVFSYVGARLAFPLYDGTYVAIDARVGFHWRDWVLALDRNPSLAQVLWWIYRSCEAQLLLLLPLLFLRGHSGHVQRFLVAFLYSAGVVTVLATLFPAAGGYDFFGLVPSGLSNIDVAFGQQHLHDLMALRAHEMTQLPLEMKGLVTFPSFHATLAVLLIYLGWPIALLRMPLVLVNTLMVVSTIACGGHYLVDVAGGLAIAWHSLWLARRSLRA
jgi:membrane-associated phospholipid phosphatase